MSDQLKSNPELDVAINSATTASELREKMLRTLAAQGTIVRSQDSDFNNRLIIRPSEPKVSVPANGFKFEKEICFHPDSGKRALVIRANSQAELEELEAQILGY